MDVIRAVLGDPKINYLGFSYGTYLGTMYAELFPEKVGRMVLDGAVDPTVSDLDALATQMTGFDNALRAYMDWCLSDECPFTGSADSALADARALMAGVDGRNLVASDGRVLDSATVGTAVAQDLYSDSLWPSLTGVFAGLQTGDADPAFAQADSYNGREADGSYPDNGSDIYFTVDLPRGRPRHRRRRPDRGRRRDRRGRSARRLDPRLRRLRGARRGVLAVAGAVRDAADGVRRRGRRADHRHRHEQRPGDAVCERRLALEAALERRARSATRARGTRSTGRA